MCSIGEIDAFGGWLDVCKGVNVAAFLPVLLRPPMTSIFDNMHPLEVFAFTSSPVGPGPENDFALWSSHSDVKLTRVPPWALLGIHKFGVN